MSEDVSPKPARKPLGVGSEADGEIQIRALLSVRVLDPAALERLGKTGGRAKALMPRLRLPGGWLTGTLVGAVLDEALDALSEGGTEITDVRHRVRRRRSDGGSVPIDVWFVVTSRVVDAGRLASCAAAVEPDWRRRIRESTEPDPISEVSTLVMCAVERVTDRLGNGEAVAVDGASYGAGAPARSRSQRHRTFLMAWRGTRYRADGDELDRRLLREASDGNPTRVRWLMALGADPSVIGPDGMTPLTLACHLGHWAAADELLRWQRSLRYTLPRRQGWWALRRAIELGQDDFAAFLIDAGAADEAQSAPGDESPEHLAASLGRTRLLAHLAARKRT